MTNNEIRSAFATIANNTKEQYTREFALEQFQKLSESQLLADMRKPCEHCGELRRFHSALEFLCPKPHSGFTEQHYSPVVCHSCTLQVNRGAK